MNGYVSNEENISCGIPQGSTVGPLMYIIYVNDILSSINACKYYMYADDTVIYTTGSVPECTERLTTDLNTFKQWCNKNKLTLNVKKTKYTIFGLRSQTKHLRIDYGDDGAIHTLGHSNLNSSALDYPN